MPLAQLKTRSRSVSLWLCVLALAGLGACRSTNIPTRSQGVSFANPSAGSEVVFDGPALTAMGQWNDKSSGDSIAWRDASLPRREAQSALDQSMWPEARRLSMDRPGRIYLNTHSESLLYFREGYQFQSQTSTGFAFPR